jgi:hypothetical protein
MLSNVLLLLVLFVLIVLGILLFMKTKQIRISKLEAGICPNCDAKEKQIQTPNGLLKIPAIESKLLKSHGCSGVADIEYYCKECEIKEVHTVPIKSACGL